jgi:hypothetical protein
MSGVAQQATPKIGARMQQPKTGRYIGGPLRRDLNSLPFFSFSAVPFHP